MMGLEVTPDDLDVVCGMFSINFRAVLVGRGRHAPQRGPTRRPCPQLSVSAGPIQPTSPLARERCAASFCTFCGISLSRPFCGTRAEIQPTFQKDILRSLSGV